MKSYISLFRNYANFSGFMKRGAYWTAMIIHGLILAVPLYPLVRFLVDDTYQLPGFYIPWVLPIWCFYYLLMIIPVWSATVRRFHTLPRRGWWLLVGLVPVIGSFLILIWLLQKGNYEEFMSRLKKSGAGTLEEVLRLAERPQKGGWFFAAFALLAVGGWLLNNRIAQTGFQESFQTAIQEVSVGGLASLRDNKIAKIATEQKATPVPTKAAAAAVLTAAPSPLPAEEEEPVIEKIGIDRPVEIEAVEITDIQVDPLFEAQPDSSEETLDIEAVSFTVSPSLTNASNNMLDVSGGFPVIAKKDGAVLLPTENDVWASVYAVTVAQYNLCAADGSCEDAEASYQLAYPGLSDEEAEVLPMIYVSRDQAAAYCEWAGMRLPTADEWQTAAALNEGTKIRSTNVNSIGTNRKSYMKDSDRTALTIPVTAFRSGASVYHMIQMFGNTWEWVDASDSGLDMAKGGAWNSYPDSISMETALETIPGYSADNIGFRCFVDRDAMSSDLFMLSDLNMEDFLNPDVRTKDNAQMVSISGGTFKMGVANGAIDEKPVHDVTLSPYWIDAYEVTNRQYALCVADGACTEPHETKSFRRASYYGNPDYDEYPVIYVDRNQAAAYCEWAEGRLPTEAEWEYAAKGLDGNAYPWGNTFTPSNLNYSGNGDYDTLAVDATPNDISDFGVYNMGGNVSEWVLDRYQENWYTVTNQPNDPTGPENGNYYVIRGSSAQAAENNARTADRFYALGTSFTLDRGFRCVVPEN